MRIFSIGQSFNLKNNSIKRDNTTTSTLAFDTVSFGNSPEPKNPIIDAVLSDTSIARGVRRKVRSILKIPYFLEATKNMRKDDILDLAESSSLFPYALEEAFRGNVLEITSDNGDLGSSEPLIDLKEITKNGNSWHGRSLLNKITHENIGHIMVLNNMLSKKPTVEESTYGYITTRGNYNQLYVVLLKDFDDKTSVLKYLSKITSCTSIILFSGDVSKTLAGGKVDLASDENAPKIKVPKVSDEKLKELEKMDEPDSLLRYLCSGERTAGYSKTSEELAKIPFFYAAVDGLKKADIDSIFKLYESDKKEPLTALLEGRVTIQNNSAKDILFPYSCYSVARNNADNSLPKVNIAKSLKSDLNSLFLTQCEDIVKHYGKMPLAFSVVLDEECNNLQVYPQFLDANARKDIIEHDQGDSWRSGVGVLQDGADFIEAEEPYVISLSNFGKPFLDFLKRQQYNTIVYKVENR